MVLIVSFLHNSTTEEASEADADTLSDAIEDKFPECEVEVNFGGQPIYYYMISVE